MVYTTREVGTFGTESDTFEGVHLKLVVRNRRSCLVGRVIEIEKEWTSIEREGIYIVSELYPPFAMKCSKYIIFYVKLLVQG